MATSTSVQNGKITQVIGPVVDVEFPPGGLPDIYTALSITKLFNPSACLEHAAWRGAEFCSFMPEFIEEITGPILAAAQDAHLGLGHAQPFEL